MKARQQLERIREAAEKMRPLSIEWKADGLTPREAVILPLVKAKFEAAENTQLRPVVISSTEIIAEMKAKGITAGIEHDADSAEFHNEVSNCLSGISASHPNEGVFFIIIRVFIGGASHGHE